MSDSKTISLKWIGPYSLLKYGPLECFFDSEHKEKKGIYIWTIKKGDVFLPYYLGKAEQPFAARLWAEVKSIQSGKWVIYEPAMFANAIKNVIHNPRSGNEHFKNQVEAQMMLGLLQIFILPVTEENKDDCFQGIGIERLERQLIWHLGSQCGLVYGFLDNLRINKPAKRLGFTLYFEYPRFVESHVSILGMPDKIEI